MLVLSKVNRPGKSLDVGGDPEATGAAHICMKIMLILGGSGNSQ